MVIDVNMTSSQPVIEVTKEPRPVIEVSQLPGSQGPPGPQGEIGPPGPPGAANAAYSGTWRWTTSTIDAATSGRVGINTTDWASVTQVNVNETTYGGSDVSAFMDKLKIGDNIYLQEKTNAANYGRYDITAITDQGTWRAFTVTLVSSGGVLPANNADVDISFLTQGAQVEEWLGASGIPAGTLGKTGDWYLNFTNGDVYEKTDSTTWTLRTNIKGAPGQWTQMTQAAYDALPTKDPNTLYVIVG